MLRISMLQGTIEGITIEGVNGEPEQWSVKGIKQPESMMREAKARIAV